MKTTKVTDMIGNTPMIELKKFDVGPCRLFIKLENQNPAGSIKDRVALSMIEAAEKNGDLKPGGTLIEATAGNTGLGLALVAGLKGYRLKLVIPDKMSREKIFHLRAMGAEVVLTRSDVTKGHPEYYQDVAARIARETGAVYINQFENWANPKAHEEGTGPEIWEQMQGELDAVVVGVGSGGTMTGLSRYFSRVSPKTKMVLADPVGSILVDYVEKGKFGDSGSWLVEGIGEDFIPKIADLSHVEKAYSISDKESFEMARQLLQKEGILAGSSSGTLLAAAVRYCREQTTPKRVVTFACDSGNKYLSKMFNDYWMIEQGFIQRPKLHDLRDIIGRRHDEGASITLRPDDTLLVAYNRMKLYDVSQLPVLSPNEEGSKGPAHRIVGFLDESDILLSIVGPQKKKDPFKSLVHSAMTTKVETLPAQASMADLLLVFEKGNTPLIVNEKGEFCGLITRIDLLQYLRRHVAESV